MSFLRWEAAALQQLTLTATAASIGRCSSAAYDPIGNVFFFLKKIRLSVKSLFAAKQCLERVCLPLLLCKKTEVF